MRVISLLCAVLYGQIQGQCRPRSWADSSMRTTGACGAPNVNVMAVPLPSGMAMRTAAGRVSSLKVCLRDHGYTTGDQWPC
jgi:hypothetical protein